MKPVLCIPVIVILLFLLRVPSTTRAQDTFLARLTVVLQTAGWEVNTKNSQTFLRYFSPNGLNGRGFMGSYGLKRFHFRFDAKKSVESIPWANTNIEQIYRSQAHSSRMFGVQPGSKASYAHGLTTSSISFRYNNRVFTFGNPIADNYTPIIDLIREYCRATEEGDLPGFEKNISAIYKKDKEFYEAVTLLQKYLTGKGLYKEVPDGNFGYDTAESFQIFLQHNGYYPGPIDRSYGKSTRNAIQKLQEDNGIQQTGILDLHTVKSIINTYP